MFESKEGAIKPIVYVGIMKTNKLLLVDYKNAPNPNKTGWWIPAPGLEYGEDPQEKAQKVCEEMEIIPTELKLHGVESFVTPGGWHLIYHYTVKTNTEPKSHMNIKNYRWVTAEELAQMQDIAHGKWEANVGLDYLSAP